MADGSGFRDSCAYAILVKISKQRRIRIRIIYLGEILRQIFWFTSMEHKGIGGLG